MNQPLWILKDFWYRVNDLSAQMTVVSRGKCFELDLSPIQYGTSELRNTYAEFLEIAGDFEDFERSDFAIQDLQNWAIQPFLSIFNQIEPNPISPTVTFYDYLYPDIYRYLLYAENNKLVPYLDYRVRRQGRLVGVDLDKSLQTQWPVFKPWQIQICPTDPPELALALFPRKITVSGKTLSMKPAHYGGTKTVLREIESYRKIRELPVEVRNRLQTPQLHGLVQEENSPRIIGLLLSWIDCDNMTLQCTARPGADLPTPLKQKWLGQVESTLQMLHEAGIIWGDAKPANMLIDSNQDAWIIDFGGGYTRGYVDKEKAGTIEGDKQGLSKIREHLC